MSKLPLPSEDETWPKDLSAIENLHVYLEKIQEEKSEGEFVASFFDIICNSMNPEAAIWWQPSNDGLRWIGSRNIQVDDTDLQCPYTNDVVACAESVVRSEAPDIFICDSPLPESAGMLSSEHLVELVKSHRQLVLPIRNSDNVVAVFTLFEISNHFTLESLTALQEQVEKVLKKDADDKPSEEPRNLKEDFDLLQVVRDAQESASRAEETEQEQVSIPDLQVVSHLNEAETGGKDSSPGVPERLGEANSDANWSEADELKLRQRAVAAVSVVTRSLDETQCCFDIANELDHLLDADRVTVCVRRGGKCSAKAISNQPVFDARSAHVKVLEEIATVCLKTKMPIWHPQDRDDLPNHIDSIFNRYYENSDGQSVSVIPLIQKRKGLNDPESLQETIGNTNSRTEQVVGVVIVEGLTKSVSKIHTERILGLVREPIVNALANATTHSSLFLMPLWKILGTGKEIFIGHHRRKAITITGVLLLALASLFAIPSELKLRSEGTIQPTNRANVFAATAGVIEEILAEDGQWVEEGQVLLRLQDPALAAELAKVEGDLREAEEMLRTNKLQRMRGDFDSKEHRKASVLEAAGLQASLDNLRQQHELLQEKSEQLVVRSPMKGMVISWDTRRKLINRPVETGQKLLAVVDSQGDWELELKLADQRSGYLRSIWPSEPAADETDTKTDFPQATYVLASEPTKVYSGAVSDFSRRADVDEKLGNIVRVYVDAKGLDDGVTSSLRPGTEVIAQIHVGKHSLGYCKLFEFFDWVQRVWFKYA